MKLIFKILLIIAVVSLTLPGRAKNNSTDKNDVWSANSRKAGYMLIEASQWKDQNNYSAFYDLVRRAHELDPSNTMASFYLGYGNLTLNDPALVDESLELMRTHIDANPKNYYDNFIYASLCDRLSKNKEAVRVWERLSDIYPNKPDLKYKIADSYAGTNDYKKAISVYDSIETQEGITQPVSLRKINFYLSLNDTVNSINEARKLLNSAPNNLNYNALMGDLFLQLEMPDSAYAYYDKMEKLEPDNGLVYLSKANYYNYKNDSINHDKQIYKALMNENLDVDSKLKVLTGFMREMYQNNDSSARVDTLFKALISQHPHEADIHRLYGRYLADKKNYKAASEQLSYVLDIEPTSADDWRLLMIIYLMSEDYNNAIQAAQKSLEYNPDNIELYQYIAPAYYQMKEYDKAIDVYNMALSKVDSTNMELRGNLLGGLGDTYFGKNDTIKAFETYEKSLDAFPGNPVVLNNYAYFLSESNKDLDKAEKMSAIAVKTVPDNSTYLDTYAWVYFKKREYKLAKLYIEKALDNSEEPNADLYEHYGDILFMSGDPTNAVEQWEKALKLNPDSDLLQRKVKFKTYFYK